MVTVLGATGYVGSNLLNKFRAAGTQVYAPTRDADLRNKQLGHVVYCIGMTADFRTKPFDTIESHVCVLKKILQESEFESLTYLSSTRVYIKSKNDNNFVTEEDDIVINSSDSNDIFAASKITGELLALNSGRKNIKIVRLSNVFGSDLFSQNFLTALIKEALRNNRVELFTTSDSAKDYISISDVCEALYQLSFRNETGIYNLAYGQNTANERILNVISKITGAEIVYSAKAQKIIFKTINTSKMNNELGFRPKENVIDLLPGIISVFKNRDSKWV